MKKSSKIPAIIGHVLAMVFTFFACVVALSARWALTTWSNLKMEEMIFELRAPLKGTGGGMIRAYVLNAIVPSVVICAVLLLISRILKKKGKKQTALIAGMLIGAAAALAVSLTIFWQRVEVGKWLRGLGDESNFIEENYADPNEVTITFPEKKRNLVYIYLESMETTFADPENGGAFEKNVIPELTELAEENEDFSGPDTALNGGISMPGTTWTMGAIFAETSGLPLKLAIGANAMDTMDSFFPQIRTLGDILEEAGYRQRFVLGSDVTFGGRRLYFTDHGDYEFEDYVYAKEQGLIPEDYNVFWGYEDEKLFTFAKDSLTKMAAESEESGEPFNFTLLTVDTHFEDGYVCELCGDEFGDNQYANVFACSSRQTTEFVRWIMEQDFFENTTIILSGDHPTMDSDFCVKIDPSYQRRVYTCVINSAKEMAPDAPARVFSTFDAFPTTLSALGATIEGDRLGLGTDLYSGTETLTEQYGLEMEKDQLEKRSTFLESLEVVDTTSEKYLKRKGLLPSAKVHLLWDESEEGQLLVRIDTLRYLFEPLTKVEAVFGARGKKAVRETYEAEFLSDGTYRVSLPITEKLVGSASLTINGIGESGESYQLYKYSGPLLLAARGKFADYLDGLSRLDDCIIFMAVRDDASTGLSEEMKAGLQKLGLNIIPKFRQTYYAIIDGDKVEEKADDEKLDVTGTLEDGTEYEIISGGYNTGLAAEVWLNGENKAPIKKRGYNIVVYDKSDKKVINSISFDTYSGDPRAKITIKDPGLFSKSLSVRIEEIGGCTTSSRGSKNEPNAVNVEVWTDDDPGTVTTYALTQKSEDTFAGKIDATPYKGKKIWIRFRVFNASGAQFVVDTVSREIA